MKKTIPVKISNKNDLNNFEEHFKKDLYAKREPLLIKSLNIGDCVTKWSSNYLKQKLNNKLIKIHSSKVSSLDFVQKNFQYKTSSFGDFLTTVENSQSANNKEEDNEYVYLRSLGDDSRKDICDLWKHFPEISDDLNIPDLFEKERYFSSVFRIASKGLQLWTHYDVMDNILIEVSGEKKVVLFSPEQAEFLYLSGDKSRVTDIENTDFTKYPLFKNVVHHECLMKPGDVLFIPALWFHNVTNTSATISVNVFWRHLDDGFYDNKDVYGNKDLINYSSAENIVDRAINKLSTLPEDYKRFYARRLIERIRKKCL